jgi:hypothetical protein
MVTAGGKGIVGTLDHLEFHGDQDQLGCRCLLPLAVIVTPFF